MKTRTILLVEDNPDDEMLTLRALKKNNIVNEITVAHDGAEALDLIFSKASSGEPLPGLVLLDLKLPKVVILTGSKLDEDILAGYRGGANAYVRKPVNFAEFAEAVKTLGLFWLILNEPVPEFMPQPD